MPLREALRAYAHDLGLAFQITDDLLDVEGSREETGKAVRKDAEAGKATFVSILGVERARAQAQGISPRVLNTALAGVTYLPDVVAKDRNQAEFTRKIWDYLDFAVSPIRVENGQAWLYNASVEEYSHGNQFNHKPVVPRKLLLHKKEIAHLFHESSITGNTSVPLRVYWKKNRIKVEIAICSGKAQHDRRQDLKKRDADLEMKRALAQTRRN
jgi:SsrA-binding protein